MTQKYILIDGEKLTKREVRKLVDIFTHECKEYAGKFFDLCRCSQIPGADAGRSEKFRAFWDQVGQICKTDPQVCYVESHYQNFAEDVRAMMAGMLARPDVTEFDKQRIHKALIVQQMLGECSQHTPVQLQKDSQAFAGDGYENKQTATNFGNTPDQSALAKLLGSTTVH
jgi:hypothetical protein